MRSEIKKPNIVIIMLLVSYCAVAATLISPSLPDITISFHLDSFLIQLIIILFAFGYGFGQLLFGPLANLYGRKPALYIGMAFAFIASVLSGVAGPVDSYGLLLFSRILTAFAGAVGLVISFAMVGDVYNPSETRKMTGWIILAFVFVPAFMAAIGGFLVEHISWESCFYFQAIYSAILVFLIYLLPETFTKRKKIHLKQMLIGLKEHFLQPKLILYAWILSCGTTYFFLYAAKGPFIGIDEIGLSPSYYGLLTLLMPAGLFIGVLLTRYCARFCSAHNSIWIGCGIIGVSAMAMFWLFYFDIINPWTLVIPNACIWTGLAFTYTNSSAIAISVAEDKAYGSSVINFVNICSGAVGTLIYSSIFSHWNLMLPISFLIIGLFMTGCLVALQIIFHYQTRSVAHKKRVKR